MEATGSTSAAGTRSRAADRWLFARNFLRHPHMLGSIIPSSRYLVSSVLAPIDWSRARVIVEYGPGVGTFTGEILRRMRGDARLIVIETNAEFVQFLEAQFPDKRLRVEQDSAENAQRILRRIGLQHAQYVVSGVPLGSMPKELQLAITAASHALLEREGLFLVYQFTRRVLPILRRTFARVRRQLELRNIPPAQLFVCSKEDSVQPRNPV